jgi:hypothetical protein
LRVGPLRVGESTDGGGVADIFNAVGHDSRPEPGYSLCGCAKVAGYYCEA